MNNKKTTTEGISNPTPTTGTLLLGNSSIYNYFNTSRTYSPCTVNICILKNRLPVKTIDNKHKIYLKDKTEFVIELYNPNSYPIAAEIELNGKSISDSKLILSPFQRTYLERYIDNDNKFLFDIFEVDNVKDTEAARERNGLIKVNFYKETYSRSYLSTGTSTITYSNSKLLLFDAKVSDFTGDFNTSSNTSTSCYHTNSIETGRVNEGDKSNQNLSEVSGYEFDDTIASSYIVQLLPESLAPVEPKIKVSNYCTECGTKRKKDSWKFCPTCGEELK